MRPPFPKLRRNAFLFLAACAATALFTTAAVAQDAEESDRPVMLTYVPAFKTFDLESLPYDKLTHICHAFATANPDGSLKLAPEMSDPRLIQLAHEHGTKVLLSLGGAASDPLLAPVAADPKKLQRFVNEIIAFVEDKNYDGVDVDWEFPDSEASAEGMIRLVRQLRARLDTLGERTDRDYIMTRAVGGGWAYAHIPTDVFVDNFDFLNVMCYDCAGPWVGIAAHNAPLTAAEEAGGQDIRTVQTMLDHWLVERAIPKSQLVLGLAAYGRGFKGVGLYEPVEKNSPAHTVYGYNELVGMMKDGWTSSRLSNGEVWLTSPDRDEVVGYDDPQSIAMKAKWASQLGLRGVFFWEASQDLQRDGTSPLLTAASNAFQSDAP